MLRPRLALSWLACVLASAAGAATTTSCDGLRVAEPEDAGGGSGDSSTAEEPSPTPGGDGGATDGAAPSDASSKKRTIAVLASGFQHPLEIALADDMVFFTLEFDQTATVRKVQKDGGGSAIVSPYDAASGLNALGNDIVIVGPDVVWANGTAGAGRILAAPRAGGQERVIKGSIDTPYHLAFYGGELYYVDRALSPATYALQRVPLAGGPSTPLSTYQIRVGGIAVDGTGVYWTHGGPLANGKNGVRRQALAGGPDATADLHVGNDNGDIGGLALGPNEVFWADTEGGRVLRVPKTGGLTTVLADSLAAPMRVAYDGAHVYFSQHGLTSAANGKISRVPAGGGQVEDLAVSLDHPVGVAVDTTHVYWASYGGGEVARTEK